MGYLPVGPDQNGEIQNRINFKVLDHFGPIGPQTRQSVDPLSVWIAIYCETNPISCPRPFVLFPFLNGSTLLNCLFLLVADFFRAIFLNTIKRFRNEFSKVETCETSFLQKVFHARNLLYRINRGCKTRMNFLFVFILFGFKPF